MLKNVELTGKRVRTNSGMVHAARHREPWFIAMSDAPTTAGTFDYCSQVRSVELQQLWANGKARNSASSGR